jgi:hypothetical protein
VSEQEVVLEQEPSFEDQVVEAITGAREEVTEPVDAEVIDESDVVASTELPEVEEPAEQEPEAPTQAVEEEMIPEYVRTIGRALKNNPDLAQAVVAIERGEAVPVPREVIEAAQRFQQERQEPQTDDFEERFWADPAAAVRELRESQEQFRAWQQQQAQAVAMQDQARKVSLLENTAGEWRSSHSELTQEQHDQLVQTVGESQLIRRALKNHGDQARAIREAFDAALLLDFPDLSLQAKRDEAVRQATRNRRAAATAASPRSARQPVEEARPRTPAERHKFTADIVREFQSAQQ